MYERAQGSERAWIWSPPVVREASRFALPASPTALQQRHGVIGVTGQWNNARFSVMCDLAWADIQFQIYARVSGGNEILIHASTPRQGNSRVEGGVMYSDVLIVQGFPCDGFTVYALCGLLEVPSTTRSFFTLSAWGDTQCCEPRELIKANNAGEAIPAPPSFVLAVPQPCHLVQLIFHHFSPAGATRYLFLFDRVTAVGVGDVPETTPIRLFADQQGALLIPDRGDAYRNGLTVAWSSTDRTFTASVSADLLFTAWYRLP